MAHVYSAIVFVILLVGCVSVWALTGPVDGDTAASKAVQALKTELEGNGIMISAIVKMSYEDVDGGRTYYMKMMNNKTARKFFIVKINRNKAGKHRLLGQKSCNEFDPIRAF